DRAEARVRRPAVEDELTGVDLLHGDALLTGLRERDPALVRVELGAGLTAAGDDRARILDPALAEALRGVGAAHTRQYESNPQPSERVPRSHDSSHPRAARRTRCLNGSGVASSAP